MKMPPILITLGFLAAKDRFFKLWLPVGIVWLLLAPLFVLVMPLAVLADIVTGFTFHCTMIVWSLGCLPGECRGLRVRVTPQGHTQPVIHIHVV
jgi:hypothetical protein